MLVGEAGDVDRLSLLVLEALIHLGVATGLLPTKGLPLPLVSYGGTSMVMNLVACALIFQASRASSILRAPIKKNSGRSLKVRPPRRSSQAGRGGSRFEGRSSPLNLQP